MNRLPPIVILFAGLAATDGVTAAPPVRLPEPGQASVAITPSDTRPAAHEMLLQPAGIGNDAVQPPANGEPLPLGNTAADLSLEELEQLAFANNPAIAQAAAHAAALRGRWVQVGLPPNPTAGYTGTEIGNDGRAGQQGGFVGQEFVTGGKLRLNRAIVDGEIQQAEQFLEMLRLRTRTDVRRAFYAALIAQRRMDLADELVRITGQAVESSRELLQAQEIPQAGLLQTQVEQQNAAILLQAATNERSGAWRELSAVVGSDLAERRVSGDVSQLPAGLDWDEQLRRLTTSSPEMAAAFANVSRAEAVLRRESVEPIPNLDTQVSVQFDNATEDTITSVTLGVPLPIWNRNQGGIRQAQAEVTEARRSLQRTELDIKRRLAVAFQQYATARAQAEAYATEILPKAQETLELVQRGYRLGELGYLDLLTAQRTYSQTNLSYLDALSALWANWNEIDGLLLSGSLSVPPQ
jgi:cobalt-zinc-cadmium efflux system outer membrane protein